MECQVPCLCSQSFRNNLQRERNAFVELRRSESSQLTMARGWKGSQFDFKKLCDSFVEICPDFGIMSDSQNLESLDFANRVIFELGPEMRQLKQSGKDKMWCLNFHGGGSVYVYTYTFQKPINGQPRLGGGKLYLTLKQAGLLAVQKICDVLPTHLNPREKIL
ncbi:uncharacterized protein Dana_GF25298, isoform B [Drosophila ananassae]|uniref:Uncharacterized protein, isoform B n=1 Tax=Drosophila ananassae TaxID=7217 RepID=B3M4L2_DROAN|nr:uncharacterized protein Dana_GF25298, isoform B [Drosophila ananassae]